MTEFLYPAFLFAFGLLFGSFLNVVIHRLPRAESETSTWWVGYGSLVNPRRSQCPHCGHAITWYENIPVVSWLALRGRCAGCKAPISPRYVLVELMTGLLFVACFVRFGLTYPLLPALVMVLLVVPLVFIDAEHWILPFELTLPGIALGLALALPLGWDAARNALIGAAAGFLGFRVMEYFGWLMFRKEALGAGDKYLLALLGAFLGWRPLFGVLFLSSLQGAVFGGVNLLLRGRAGPEAPGTSPDGAAGADGSSSSGPSPTSHAALSSNAAPTSDAAPTAQGAPTSSANAVPTPPTADGAPPTADGAPPTADGSTSADDATADDADEVFTFTPDFLRPGLSFPRRLALLPWTLLFQPIPDDPPLAEGDKEGGDDLDDEWVPGATSLPFGPWIGLAGLEVLLLTPWLHATFAGTPFGLTMKLIFGTPG